MHTTRHEKQSKLGGTNPIVATGLFTLQARARHDATSNKIGPGSIFLHRASRPVCMGPNPSSTQDAWCVTWCMATRKMEWRRLHGKSDEKNSVKKLWFQWHQNEKNTELPFASCVSFFFVYKLLIFSSIYKSLSHYKLTNFCETVFASHSLLRPNLYRMCDVTRMQTGTFFLWCCLRAVWTPPLTITGPICWRYSAHPM